MNNNRNIPPAIWRRMVEIAETARSDGLRLPLSPFVIAQAEMDGWVVDLETGELSRCDVVAWPEGQIGGTQC